MEDNDDISDDGKSLWSTLLQEVKEKSSKTRHIPNSLLVLGNELSGKSSLIARLQKSDSKNGVGLEFEFIDVKDESMDENKQLNVWISSGDTFHSNLLKYALDESNFEFTLCLITVSFTDPWSIMDCLEQWLDILKKHVDRLKIEPHNLSNLKESLSRHFQDYIEPVVDTVVPAAGGKRRDADFNYLHPNIVDDPDKVVVPLGDGVFDKNLGIPIIVVITKTDQITTLEQEYQYDDDRFDFIQMNVRKLCLKYGAALCYTSLKNGQNCDLLLRYILHRCYGFPFIDMASVIEKDAIFIPAGWDNTNKINILADNLPEDTRHQSFDAFITKPVSLVRAAAQNRLSEPEMTEDEQVFLMRQQAQIQRLKNMANADPNAKPDPGRGAPLPKGTSVASSGPGRSRKNLAGQASVAANPANPGVQGNERVLANFFSSLLNKRAGPPLQSQNSNVSDQGEGVESYSETEDSIKEDSRAEDAPGPVISDNEEKSSPAPATNVGVESQMLEEVVTESKEILNEAHQKNVVEIGKDVTHQEIECKESGDDKCVSEHLNEVLTLEDTEPDDENSTGKQISELEENVDPTDNICELKMDVDNEHDDTSCEKKMEESTISGIEDNDNNVNDMVVTESEEKLNDASNISNDEFVLKEKLEDSEKIVEEEVIDAKVEHDTSIEEHEGIDKNNNDSLHHDEVIDTEEVSNDCGQNEDDLPLDNKEKFTKTDEEIGNESNNYNTNEVLCEQKEEEMPHTDEEIGNESNNSNINEVLCEQKEKEIPHTDEEIGNESNDFNTNEVLCEQKEEEMPHTEEEAPLHEDEAKNYEQEQKDNDDHDEMDKKDTDQNVDTNVDYDALPDVDKEENVDHVDICKPGTDDQMDTDKEDTDIQLHEDKIDNDMPYVEDNIVSSTDFIAKEESSQDVELYHAEEVTPQFAEDSNEVKEVQLSSDSLPVDEIDNTQTFDECIAGEIVNEGIQATIGDESVMLNSNVSQIEESASDNKESFHELTTDQVQDPIISTETQLSEDGNHEKHDDSISNIENVQPNESQMDKSPDAAEEQFVIEKETCIATDKDNEMVAGDDCKNVDDQGENV